MAGLFLRASKSVATGSLSVLEDPRSADFVRALFDGVATVPVAHGGAFSLRGFDVLGEFSIDTAGMALDDVVQVECASGCGHRLYSDREPLSVPATGRWRWWARLLVRCEVGDTVLTCRYCVESLSAITWVTVGSFGSTNAFIGAPSRNSCGILLGSCL